MWGALARQVFAYVLTRRGKRVMAIVGLIFLGFVTTLLVDLRLYLTAAFTGLLTSFAVLGWFISSFKQRRRDRQLQQIEAQETLRRAAAAASRSETMQKARSSVADAARNVTSGAYGAAMWGISGAWDTVTLKRWRRGATEPPSAQRANVLRIPRIAHTDHAVRVTIDHR